MTSRFAVAASALVLVTFAVAGCGSIGGLTGYTPGSSTENVPPSVVSVQPPADGAAPADTPVTLTFNKPMSPAGLEISAEPPVTFGPTQWSDDAKTVSVRPTSTLVPGTRYTIRVRARDRQGNMLARDQVWSFTATAPTGVAGEGQLRLAERIDVGSDARVFTLFAALLAATPDSPAGEPGSVRAAVRTKMRDLPARVTDPVRKFLADNPASVEQYLTAALLLSGPPELREPSGPATTATTNRELAGLGPVLAQFYTGAGIADLWKAHERAYADAVAAHRKDAPALLGRAVDYLRSTVVPAARIGVLPNLVDVPGQGYLVRQGDRAFIIASSRGGVDRLGLLRPFARLMLEPLRGQSGEHLQRTEPLYAQARELAARNGYRSWPDVVIASLIEATAIRLAITTDDAASPQRSAYARGLVLVDHFTSQLAEYERTTVSLADYYPRMVTAIDLDVELRRWAERKPG